MHIAVSACLLGERCRYDGGTKPDEAVIRLSGKTEPVPICPERLSGLPIPRPPAEIRDGHVYLRDGRDVTEEFETGAKCALARVREQPVPLAVLKAKSPSCGAGLIYDGSYSGRTIEGDGVFARLLEEEGITVVSETTVESVHPSVEHPVAIILGTGLGHLKSLVHPVRRIDYHDIEGFPDEAQPMPGHTFEATIGTIDNVPVIVYPGRIHLYQGYSASEICALVRHAHRHNGHHAQHGVWRQRDGRLQGRVYDHAGFHRQHSPYRLFAACVEQKDPADWCQRDFSFTSACNRPRPTPVRTGTFVPGPQRDVE